MYLLKQEQDAHAGPNGDCGPHLDTAETSKRSQQGAPHDAARLRANYCLVLHLSILGFTKINIFTAGHLLQ